MEFAKLQEKARELADMVGSVVVDEYLPIEILEVTADILKEGGGSLASKTEKHTVAYRNVKKCEFHNIGAYIVAISIIGGTTFCAFFDSGLHTVESIKRRGSIKLHSIYSKK